MPDKLIFSDQRMLRNDEAVEKLFTRFGYTTLILGEMTVADRINLEVFILKDER